MHPYCLQNNKKYAEPGRTPGSAFPFYHRLFLFYHGPPADTEGTAAFRRRKAAWAFPQNRPHTNIIPPARKSFHPHIKMSPRAKSAGGHRGRACCFRPRPHRRGISNAAQGGCDGPCSASGTAETGDHPRFWLYLVTMTAIWARVAVALGSSLPLPVPETRPVPTAHFMDSSA